MNSVSSSTSRESYLTALSLSAIIAVSGAVGLAVLETRIKIEDHHQWWYLGLFYAATSMAHVGALGVVVELFFRRRLYREFTHEVRNLFSEDPSLARSLNEETRKKRVQNVLIAQLGEEGGQAVYSALAERYLTGISPLRWNETLDVTIEALKEDVEIALPSSGETVITLSRDDYYRVTVNSSYEGVFNERHRCVACILVEDSEELNLWFKRDDCFFRDVVCLNETDRSSIIDRLNRIPSNSNSRKAQTEKIAAVSKLFSVDVVIDNNLIPVQRVKLSSSGRSIELILKVSNLIKTGKRVRYEIRQVSVLAKSVNAYPVIFAEPCQNPSVTFHYPAANITKVNEAVFLTGKSPFEPEVIKSLEARFIKVSVPPSMGPLWVFPNSGVVFTWDSHQD